jgi:hypothetical protein
MKLSTIGASIVAFATGVGAILTVIEKWHNIEQWNTSSSATSTAVVSPIVPPVQTGPGSGDNEAAHSRAEQAAADARAAEDRAAVIRVHEARQSSPSGPGQYQETE